MEDGNRTTNGRLSPKIVRAIAEVEGDDPRELDFRLHDFVPPDALDTLYRGDEAQWELTLRIADHVVQVDDRGSVVVDGRAFN